MYLCHNKLQGEEIGGSGALAFIGGKQSTYYQREELVDRAAQYVDWVGT